MLCNVVTVFSTEYIYHSDRDFQSLGHTGTTGESESPTRTDLPAQISQFI